MIEAVTRSSKSRLTAFPTSTPLPNLKPRFMRLHQAVLYSGLSRSGIYRLIADGRLLFRKAGSATLVDVASLDAYLDALPHTHNV